jgi:uncharacterized membrane protein YfcA
MAATVYLIVLPVGLLIGLSLGALGGGGSILTVPALVYLVGQDPLQATTSSLLIVGATSLIALAPHARRGNVRFAQGAAFGVLGAAGSFAGSLASARVAPAVLLAGFATLMLVVSALMVRRSVRSPEASSGDSAAARPLVRLRPFRVDPRRVVEVVLAATVVGLLTGFFGVGGGFALVPALVLVLSYPMPVAVGTSLLVIALNSATALVTRFAGSHVDWATVAVFTGAAIAGSLLGGRVAARARPQVLTLAFAALLVVVALYTGIRSLAVLV